MRGDGHDGAGAVAHEDEVGDPDGDLLAAVGVDGVVAGEEAFLIDIAGVAAGARIDHGFGAGLEAGIEQGLVERVLGREDDAGGAVDGVDARGEDADGRAGAIEVEIDLGAFGAADPVALHGEDALGPAAFELRHVVEEFVGVVGDFEEPLFEGALFDGGVFVAPAAAIHHLFVGQHGGALGAPVDEGALAVGEAALQHFEEEPLVPAIVFGLAGGDFAVPIVAEGEAAMGLLHRGDVLEGPLARRHLVGDGGILGGKSEGVPAHGVQHVEAAHPLVAGKRVADRIVADVADVEGAAGVGQHLQDVELRLGGILFGLVEIGVLPTLVPLQFDLDMVVGLLGHMGCLFWGTRFHRSKRRGVYGSTGGCGFNGLRGGSGCGFLRVRRCRGW